VDTGEYDGNPDSGPDRSRAIGLDDGPETAAAEPEGSWRDRVLGATVPKAPRTDLPVDTAVKASAAPKAPPIPKIHAELRYDESINRVVGLVVDESTGKTIQEFPPEGLRALYAKTRAMLGPLVDEKA